MHSGEHRSARFATWAERLWRRPVAFGTVALVILLDAALVRLVLVPVALRLLGRHAWWLPRPLARVLPRVRFGHA